MRGEMMAGQIYSSRESALEDPDPSTIPSSSKTCK